MDFRYYPLLSAIGNYQKYAIQGKPYCTTLFKFKKKDFHSLSLKFLSATATQGWLTQDEIKNTAAGVAGQVADFHF